MGTLIKKVTTTVEEYLQDSGEAVPRFESASVKADVAPSADVAGSRFRNLHPRAMASWARSRMRKAHPPRIR